MLWDTGSQMGQYLQSPRKKGDLFYKNKTLWYFDKKQNTMSEKSTNAMLVVGLLATMFAALIAATAGKEKPQPTKKPEEYSGEKESDFC